MNFLDDLREISRNYQGAAKALYKSFGLEYKPDGKEYCPSCGELEDGDIIDSLGECLGCDHVRADLYAMEVEFCTISVDDPY
jgi:hypothetical protein